MNFIGTLIVLLCLLNGYFASEAEDCQKLNLIFRDLYSKYKVCLKETIEDVADKFPLYQKIIENRQSKGRMENSSLPYNGRVIEVSNGKIVSYENGKAVKSVKYLDDRFHILKSISHLPLIFWLDRELKDQCDNYVDYSYIIKDKVSRLMYSDLKILPDDEKSIVSSILKISLALDHDISLEKYRDLIFPDLDYLRIKAGMLQISNFHFSLEDFNIDDVRFHVFGGILAEKRNSIALYLKWIKAKQVQFIYFKDTDGDHYLSTFVADTKLGRFVFHDDLAMMSDILMEGAIKLLNVWERSGIFAV